MLCRWRPGNIFHASALCACMIDSAMLPLRLARKPPRSPLGTPIGATDMHSLAQLLVRALQPGGLSGITH